MAIVVSQSIDVISSIQSRDEEVETTFCFLRYVFSSTYHLILMTLAGIEDGSSFNTKLQSTIADLITSTAELLDTTFTPDSLLNVAFSYQGLLAQDVPAEEANLGFNGAFTDGQFVNSALIVSLMMSRVGLGY